MSQNVHACAIHANGSGILILGASGTGKSELALDLIDQCHLRNLPAVLVADDRVILETGSDGVIARVPPTIAGLIEVRGSGIFNIRHVPQARMDFAVHLVEPASAVRMPARETVEIVPGIWLPCFLLPQRSFAAVRAVLAHLGVYGGITGPHSDN